MTIARILRVIRISVVLWLTAEVGFAAQTVGGSKEELSPAISDHHAPAATGKACFTKCGETEEEVESHLPVCLGSSFVTPLPSHIAFSFYAAPLAARHFLRHLALSARPPPSLS